MLLFKEITLFLWLSIVVHYSLYGQMALNYSGPYKAGKYEGMAEFGYKLLDGDTIFDGPFQMQHANLKDLLSKQDLYFYFEGAFQNNVPDGPWRFQFGEFTIDDAEVLEVIDYYYKVKTNGIYHETSGNILEGTPHGRWTQTTQHIRESQVQETLFKSTIDFDRGVPQKSFSIQNERMTLMGRFLRDGLAHDVWELYSADEPGVIESWHFSEGSLDKILVKKNDFTVTLEVYNDGIENPQIINLDERYLEIIKLNQRLTGDNRVEIKGKLNSLLVENAKHYRKIDDLLSKLGKSRFMPEFKVKVNYNSLNNNELNQLDSIKAYYTESKKISEALLKSTQLNILKMSDNEAFFLLSVVDELSGKHLSLLEEVTRLYDRNILSFVPREHISSILWQHDAISTEIGVTYEFVDSVITRSYKGPNAEAYQFEKDDIEGIYELAKYVAGSMESIQTQLNEKLTNEQRQTQLMMLEEGLIAEMTALNDLVDSLREKITGEPQSTLVAVKRAATNELSEYSSMNDLAKKPDRARWLTSCFDQMQDLSEKISMLQVQMDAIKVLYTDQVWNPFTATVMNEQVKRHITGAYREILVPYLFNELNNALSCNNTPQLISLLENTHKRMLALREEDTGKLERKLKREVDPLAIMQLFNIQTDNKVVKP
ncbi:MAG: hypothetical protein MI921_10430 [Cytophagales bacterium]|nr:hypothetical protein [Cytophagales bacterium]